MKVYPRRRTASFPKNGSHASQANARTVRLVTERNGVEDVYEGFPFPLPQNAYHLIWNHKMKYKGVGMRRWNNQAMPTTSGSYQLIRLREEALGLYWMDVITIEVTDKVLQ